MTPSATDPVAAALRTVEAAEDRIAKAKQERDEARELLDGALAARGWKRLRGAFGPSDSPLYQRPGNDGAWPLRDVLQLLDLERQAAA
jgi:hypothetical protein